MPPFRGQRPKSRAGSAAVIATKRSIPRRPPRTPASKRRDIRVSMPGAPPGIFVKSSLPRDFWSLIRKGQWSVATVCNSPAARARQSRSWAWRSRSGGLITYFAPSKPGPS